MQNRRTFFDPRQTKVTIPSRHKNHIISKILPLDLGFLEDDNVRLQSVEHGLIMSCNPTRQTQRLTSKVRLPLHGSYENGFLSILSIPRRHQHTTYRIPLTDHRHISTVHTNRHNQLTVPRSNAKPHSGNQTDSPYLLTLSIELDDVC